MKRSAIVAAAFLVSAGMTASSYAQDKKDSAKKGSGGQMTFFVTSAGKGSGADLGGLKGADEHCNALAKAAGSKLTNWHAYLSTTEPKGAAGINARDRIGKGPWRNAKGVVVANNVNDLHSSKNKINKQNALTEKGEQLTASVENFTGPLDGAIAALTDQQKEYLLSSVLDLIYRLNQMGIISTQRMCFNCYYYNGDRATTHYCNLVQAPLAYDSIRFECPEHKMKGK